MDEIIFILNEKQVSYDGPAGERLLDVLRERFGLTGTKCGCREGECGACSVIMDGCLVNSCMVTMGRAENSRITTIEGFSETRQFDALSRSFAAQGAVQCGFCTPGMLLAAHCLLLECPSPTESQIRDAISGNLCRCTGYDAIIRAIDAASKEGTGLW